MIDKRALRTAARATRDAAPRDRAIMVAPEYLQRLEPGLTVASYIPIGSEADPAPLATASIAAGCTLALPQVVDRATPLRFLAWADELALTHGPFGLRQPHGHANELTPDIILTPLVAFDAALNRLGQGAGHYDRAFEQYPDAWRVGVAWSVQQVEMLPIDPWDIPLHAIATERVWLTR